MLAPGLVASSSGQKVIAIGIFIERVFASLNNDVLLILLHDVNGTGVGLSMRIDVRDPKEHL